MKFGGLTGMPDRAIYTVSVFQLCNRREYIHDEDGILPGL